MRQVGQISHFRFSVHYKTFTKSQKTHPTNSFRASSIYHWEGFFMPFRMLLRRAKSTCAPVAEIDIYNFPSILKNKQNLQKCIRPTAFGPAQYTIGKGFSCPFDRYQNWPDRLVRQLVKFYIFNFPYFSNNVQNLQNKFVFSATNHYSTTLESAFQVILNGTKIGQIELCTIGEIRHFRFFPHFLRYRQLWTAHKQSAPEVFRS